MKEKDQIGFLKKIIWGGAMPHSLWDLSSPAREGTHGPGAEGQHLNAGLPGKSQESDFRPGESEAPLRYSTENTTKEVGISEKNVCIEVKSWTL